MSGILGMVIAHARNIRRIDEYGLSRAEFVLIEPESKDELVQFITERGLRFGAHCPIFKPCDHPGNNSLLASLSDWDETRRRASLELMERNLADAAALGAEYAVVHIQRPENFGGSNPPGFGEQDALESAKRSCERLLETSNSLGVPVFIENLFRNSTFNSPESHANLLDSFPELGFCLDAGHLDVDSREFGFPFDEFLDAVLPHLKEIHLQNSNPSIEDGKGRPWKIPVHPSQSASDGWLDVVKLLVKALSANPRCIVSLESRMNVPEEQDMIREGVEWMKRIVPQILSEIPLK
jgi:sugar phosphate isomerase/epimerase